MVATVCLLIPPLFMVIIRNRLFPKQTKISYKLIQYLACAIAINGLILLLLLAFFTNGDHLIYNLNHQTIFAIEYIALAMTLAIAEPLVEKGLKIKHISTAIKVISFLLLFVIGLRIVNFIAQPVWTTSDEGHNYDLTYGFYEESNNTVETLFLGSSHVRCAISPMELYEKYGICAYNISTNSQPMLASYFWLEQVYCFHAETLDTVVLDVSSLRSDPEESHYREAIDPMKLSVIKLRAVKAYSNNFTDFLEKLVPVLSYHERWKDLSEEDFIKYDYDPKEYIRGYDLQTSQWINNVSNYTDVNFPLLIFDENAGVAELDETAVKYFEKIVSFCEEHDIQLLLIKTPTSWSSADHNAIQSLADSHGLYFLDFNVEPYYSEIGFDLAANVVNTSVKTNLHLNYYGALKITDYLGNYLIQNCENKDVRGEEKYSFMNAELSEYNRYIIKATLSEIEDPAQYLSYLFDQEDYEIFISVMDDAAHSLTSEQRECFASLGLEELSSIEFRDSYLAVIDDGVIVTENIKKYDQDLDSSGEADKITDAMSVTLEGSLEDGTVFSLISCGGTTAAKSSCIVDDTEYSQNSRGINCVVYDKKLQSVADNVTFDTYESSTRRPVNIELALAEDFDKGLSYSELPSNEQNLYLYDMQCNALLAEKTAGDDGLFSYLSYFWNDDDYTVFISAKEDASGALSDETRSFLSDIGLDQLSNLHFQDSYLAIISGGEIWEEMSDHGADPIEVRGSGYTVTSGGKESGDVSSVMINGEEYSPNTRGLNIVVMNNLDSSVVSTMTFDTSEIIQSLPESWPN